MHSRKWPDADNLRHHLQGKQTGNNHERRPKYDERDEKASADEIEWREHRKGDAAHAMNECFVAQKYSCNYKADQISRQDCLAPRRGREAAEKEKNEKDELYFRFAHPCRSKPINDRLCPHWHKPEHDTHNDDEDEQPNVEVCKEPAKRE